MLFYTVLVWKDIKKNENGGVRKGISHSKYSLFLVMRSAIFAGGLLSKSARIRLVVYIIYTSAEKGLDGRKV